MEECLPEAGVLGEEGGVTAAAEKEVSLGQGCKWPQDSGPRRAFLEGKGSRVMTCAGFSEEDSCSLADRL